MPVNGAQLADGQLAAAIGDLYTVPASTRTFVKSIIYSNTGASALTVNLYVTPSGGTARRILPKDMTMDAGDTLFFDEALVLDAADKLRGDASSATTVDFTIFGGEEAT